MIPSAIKITADTIPITISVLSKQVLLYFANLGKINRAKEMKI